MVLEAVMICLDNSVYMRNGDYSPTRFEAQNEGVREIARQKTNDNQETTVGFLTMAGTRIEMHISPTHEIGPILNALQDHVKIDGRSNFVGGLKTAQLALKNRPNKNQRQRIIMFVGSPVEEAAKTLISLGKNFKKNSIGVDVINFGTENVANDNVEKLQAFVDAANNNGNCHMLSVAPGPHILSDLILTSNVMIEGGAGAPGVAAPGGAPAGGAAAGFPDPNEDPELAMVLRMSMEEERQRRVAPAASAAPATPAPAASVPVPATPATPAPQPAQPRPQPAQQPAAMDDDEEDDDEMDEDAQLQAALALSLAQGDDDEGGDVDMAAPLLQPPAAAQPVVPQTPAPANPSPALQTPAPSNQPVQAPNAPAKPVASQPPAGAGADEDDLSEALRDPDFLNDLLDSVQGVDRSELDDILNQLNDDKEEGKE